MTYQLLLPPHRISHPGHYFSQKTEAKEMAWFIPKKKKKKVGGGLEEKEYYEEEERFISSQNQKVGNQETP